MAPASTSAPTSTTARVEAAPGVESVGMLRMMHLGLGNMTTGFSVHGVEPPEGRTSFPADYNVIAGDYFEALGVPLLTGRAFRPTVRPTVRPTRQLLKRPRS